LRNAGLYPATIRRIAERHGALHWLAGFRESLSAGKRGLETADEVHALASDWLERHGRQDDWFLHVHLWDPHTPYRAPASLGEPFAGDSLPAWLTEEVRAHHFAGAGPHSAHEAVGFSTDYPYGDYPRQPVQIASMHDVRRLYDGYDLGVRVADDCVGRLIEQLRKLAVLDETVIIVSADHGETLGELNVYGDHHTTDDHVARVPMIVLVPGIGPRVEAALCYQIDVAASLIELCGGQVPASWDGKSFASELRAGSVQGRDHLVLTTGAWTCQRAVRWDRYLCLHTLHDGYHDYPDTLLFDLEQDPHELCDLSATQPELVAHSARLLERFTSDVLQGARDPLETVIAEGGPAHVRGQLSAYLERLRSTGRAAAAERVQRKHG
jgi:arylsulfatase A-like enzyme